MSKTNVEILDERGVLDDIRDSLCPTDQEFDMLDAEQQQKIDVLINTATPLLNCKRWTKYTLGDGSLAGRVIALYRDLGGDCSGNQSEGE
jgi:hypothetical protein